MLKKALRYGKGYISIHISGSSAERFLNSCRYHGVQIWGLKPCRNGYCMNILLRDFKIMKPLARKTHTRIRILKKTGIPFVLYHYGRRKPFLAGIILCVLLLTFLSQRVWNIEISGNSKYTEDMLMKFLFSENVRSGMARSEVDCSSIVNALRKQYADIVWASASVNGTLLTIHIKENEDSDETKPAEASDLPMDIVADTDVSIVRIITRKGIAAVSAGAQVKKGDLLVSGQIPVLNDQQEITAYRPEQSDADIIGQKSIDYSDELSWYYEKKQYRQWRYSETHLQIGGVRFTLGKIPDNSKACAMYGKDTQFRINKSLSLPVWYGFRTAVFYKTVPEKYTESEVRSILSVKFWNYCNDLEKKGVEIIENDVKIYTGSETVSAKGCLTIQMPVGVLKASEPKDVLPPEENEEPGDS